MYFCSVGVLYFPSCQQGYMLMLFYLTYFLKLNFTFSGKSSQVKLNQCLRKSLTRQKHVSFEVPADFPGTSERLVGILFLYTVSLASWKVVHSAYYKLCIYSGIKTCWTFCYKTEMLSKKDGKREETHFQCCLSGSLQ